MLGFKLEWRACCCTKKWCKIWWSKSGSLHTSTGPMKAPQRVEVSSRYKTWCNETWIMEFCWQKDVGWLPVGQNSVPLKKKTFPKIRIHSLNHPGMCVHQQVIFPVCPAGALRIFQWPDLWTWKWLAQCRWENAGFLDVHFLIHVTHVF